MFVTHLTLTQSLTAISTLASGWLMVRLGATKQALKIKMPARCAACGRRRTRERCPCTH
jgi:hypothetical protein